MLNKKVQLQLKEIAQLSKLSKKNDRNDRKIEKESAKIVEKESNTSGSESPNNN